MMLPGVLRPSCALVSALLFVLAAPPAAADWPSSSSFNVAICTAPSFQYAPRLASDAAGGAFVLWVDQRDGVQYDLYATRVLADGSLAPGWPVNGRAVCLAPGNVVSPRILPDGSGGAFIAWSDRRDGPDNDLYAHHLLSDGTLDPLWPTDGLLVCEADSVQILEDMVGDGAGGMVLVWHDLRNGSNRDVFMQHVSSTGLVDPSWPDSGLAVSTGPGDQTGPRMVASTGNSLLVAWHDSRSGVADVYAQRVLVNGTLDPAWPAGGRLVCGAAGNQFSTQVAPDGAGGAFIGWQDMRSGVADVYASRIRSNGTLDPAWPADGAGLCTATGEQSGLQITATRPGEAIVSWRDMRGANRDIYAARLLAAGVDPAWPANGRGVCVALGDQLAPAIVADGTGGALIAWQDNRTDTGNIYAHHVLSSSALDPLWPTDGRPVCVVGFGQNTVAALADGTGGVILAWEDDRASGLTDIYAQRVQSNGLLGGTVVDVPSQHDAAFRIESVRPNPARGGALRVDFSLATEGAVSLELIDPAGRRIAALDLGPQPAGRQSATLRIGATARGTLAFLRVRQGGRTLNRRVVLLD